MQNKLCWDYDAPILQTPIIIYIVDWNSKHNSQPYERKYVCLIHVGIIHIGFNFKKLINSRDPILWYGVYICHGVHIIHTNVCSNMHSYRIRSLMRYNLSLSSDFFYFSFLISISLSHFVILSYFRTILDSGRITTHF